MIACPICGSDTQCRETRGTAYGTRRRRECRVPTCAGRVSTIEVAVADSSPPIYDSTLTVVSTAELAAICKRLREILGEAT